ncbi:asparagine synthase (glutamine-hydrolysing) [Alteribacillus persepolensis]|uniref:asparagine synthase (glutamine-hydrolyzing) n=1 Tax=Alteribacillus persepolensis TaxID=568899 RepID=A0A1G7ZRW8_9BACI|nr:asparagine synthase (glutamine-hydrolyzing) [Alteribacillus persepolensis]SDH10850.1 asparagine synthase (glutamine-hydrolysing) [Alteribacillus persepolensis]
MCGITGWLQFHKNMKEEQYEINRMVKTLYQRGPDQQNTYSGRHIILGHTRLIVIDPEGGTQPMVKTHKRHRYVLVYNGELYNTQPLRSELQRRGYSFSSHSDTEVVLTAYMEWKESCVEKMNGIFAFAVWDEKKEKLFLARDRLGVKPLFYTEAKDGFLFGSEIKALLAHRSVQPVVKEEGLLELFSLGPSRTPGHGIYDGIKELEPAHVMMVSKRGVKIRRYWNVESVQHGHTLEETAESIREKLYQAAKRQLISDKPISTFLSGGLDSSALTAIASKEYGDNLPTYSIDYEGNEQYFTSNDYQPDSDQAYIHKMIQACQTTHHDERIKVETLADMLEEAVLARDLPGMADIDSSLLWFCKKIKKKTVVSLSGECADEIFGGYPWFYKTHLLQKDSFPWIFSLSRRQQLLHDKYRKNLHLEEYAKKRYQETIANTPYGKNDNETEQRHKEMLYLNMHWFMATLLERKDRMSMRASLEVRVPFADHELVEYVWNVPAEWKRWGGQEKGILRKALEGVVPADVLYRKKNPYPKTHHPTYTQLMTERMENVLAQKDTPLYDILDRNELKKLVESKGDSFQVPWFGQLMTGPQLLAYLWQVHYWLTAYNVQIR